MVSKKHFSAVLATAVILSIIGGSSIAFAQTETGTTTATAAAFPSQTITQIAANDTDFSTLVSLLTKANLTETLNGTGNFTVFAPTNEAFNKVSASTLAALQNNSTALKKVLLYHVLDKTLFASEIKGNGTLTTINGLELSYSVNGTKVTVDNANVTKTDINATNGVIHVIDGVMIPPRNATERPIASAVASAAGGFLGLPGFEALYAVAGLLAVAYLVIRRRK